MARKRAPKEQLTPMEQALEEQGLTEGEVLLREQFVDEYMHDFDVFRAAIRCGFQSSFAVEWGKRLYQDVYVQRRLAEEMRKKRAADEEADKAAYESNLKFLMHNGTEASRVAASKAYAEFKGWAKPDTTGDAAQDLVEAFKDIAQRLPV